MSSILEMFRWVLRRRATLGVASMVLLFIIIYFLNNWVESSWPDHLKSIGSVVKMALEAMGILCVVLIGSALERKYGHEKTTQEMVKLIKTDRDHDYAELVEKIIPGAHHFGMSEVRANLDFFDLLEHLTPGDEVDVFFTFHPLLEAALERHYRALAAKKVRVRLLLAYDRSPETIHRFREIMENRDDPNWAGPGSEGASAIAQLSTFVRARLPALKRSDPTLRLDWRVYDHLPDHPVVVVRNPSEPQPRNVKFAWVGFYMHPAAVRMPAVVWRPIPRPEPSDQDAVVGSVAVEASVYFDQRWKRATEVEDMDARYQSGKVWRDHLEKAGVSLEILDAWVANWRERVPKD